MLTRLFVGNLSFQATAEDVRDASSKPGPWERCVLSPISSAGGPVALASLRWPRGKKPCCVKEKIADDGKRHRCQKKVGHDDSVHTCKSSLEWKQW